MNMFNLRLTAATICVLLVSLSASYAQDVKAVPVPEISGEALPVIGKAPVIVELFSSQACVFCPKADKLFSDIVSDKSVIGLACHVDYFDVKQGALSHKFCTDRQSNYARQLKTGPNYTPQIVINGQKDVVAYKFDMVMNALKAQRLSTIKTLNITPQAGGYYMMPVVSTLDTAQIEFWLMFFDKPHDIKIAEGRNRGKTMTYVNIVSDLQKLIPENKKVMFKPVLQEKHAGFVVLAQDKMTGEIKAAARFNR